MNSTNLIEELLIKSAKSKQNQRLRWLVRWIITKQNSLLSIEVFSPRVTRKSREKPYFTSKLAITTIICMALILINLNFRYRYDNLKLNLRNLNRDKVEDLAQISKVKLELSNLENSMKHYIGLPFPEFQYVVQPIYLYPLWVVFSIFALCFYDKYIHKLRLNFITAMCYPEEDIKDYNDVVESELKRLISCTQITIAETMKPRKSGLFSDILVGVNPSPLSSTELVEDCLKCRIYIVQIIKTLLHMYSDRPKRLDKLTRYYLIFWIIYHVISHVFMVIIILYGLHINQFELTAMDVFALLLLYFISVMAINSAFVVLALIIFASLDQVMLAVKLIGKIDLCILHNQELCKRLTVCQQPKVQLSLVDEMNINLISVYLHFKTFAVQFRQNVRILSVLASAAIQVIFVTLTQALYHAPHLDGNIWYIYLIGITFMVVWVDTAIIHVCMMQSQSLKLATSMIKLLGHVIESDELLQEINRPDLPRSVFSRHICCRLRKEVDQLGILVDCFVARILGTQMQLTYSNLLKGHFYLSLIIISLLKGLNLKLSLL